MNDDGMEFNMSAMLGIGGGRPCGLGALLSGLSSTQEPHDANDTLNDIAASIVGDVREHNWIDLDVALEEFQLFVKSNKKTWNSFSHRDKIHFIFKYLQRAGVLVKEDFMCCQECSHYAILKQMIMQKRHPLKTTIIYYTHPSANEAFDFNGNIDTPEGLRMAHHFGEDNDDIKDQVFKFFEAAGVEATWAGHNHVMFVENSSSLEEILNNDNDEESK